MDEREKMIEQVCLTFMRGDPPTTAGFHLLGGGVDVTESERCLSGCF